MTAPGGIRIPITADGSGFDAELTRVVIAAMKGVQAKLDATPLHVTVHVDLDDGGAAAHVRAMRERLQREAAPIIQRVRVEYDNNRSSASVQRASSTGSGSSGASEAARKSADDAASAVGRLGTAIGNVGLRTGQLAGVAAIIGEIGGAAGAAAGLVGGLGAALAAVGPAAGAIAATALVGLHGIADAFKAALAADDAAPKETAAKTKAIATAQEQLTNAGRQAEHSQRELATANRESDRAATDLAKAYKAAGREIEDAAHKARGASISQAEAAIDLRDAQKAANESVFDPAQHEKDLVRLQRAQLDYDDAVTDNTRALQDNQEAQAKGLEQNDAVVAAKDKQQAAADRLIDSQDAAAKASEDVAIATKNLADAQDKATPAADKFSQAMAKLSPNAADFVTQALALKPAVEDAGKAVQDVGFQGLGDQLTDVAQRAIPAVRDGMVGVAGQFNAAAKQVLDFVGSTRGLDTIGNVFQGAANLIDGFRNNLGGATQGFVDLAAVANPALSGIGQAVGGIASSIGEAFSGSAASGQLASVFSGLTDALRGAGPLIGDLVTSLLTIADRVLPSLEPLFTALGDGLVQIAPSLGDLGKVFSDSLTSILPQLASFISALADGLQPVLPVVAQLLGSLMTALTPIIGPLSQIAVIVGKALSDALVALAPSLGPLAQSFADLLAAIEPLIPMIAGNLAVVIEALAPVLSDVAKALAPVIASFAQQMAPVVEKLAPVLGELATTVGNALADAIKQIAPSLPSLVTSFTNLLLAVVPLLPQFAKMAAEILPPLVTILVQLLPYITDLTNAFTWLVSNVIVPLVIPALQALSDDFRDTFRIISDAISFFTSSSSDQIEKVKGFLDGLGQKFGEVQDWITGHVLTALHDGLTTLTGWFQTGVDSITTIWSGLRAAAADPIKFVVNTVWNNGLRLAWNEVAKFLPGVGQMQPITLGFRSGGGVSGPGTGTSDDIPAWLSDGEHIVTAAEVERAGGQHILYAIRDMIARGIPFAWNNGQIISDLGRSNLDAYGAAVEAKGLGNVSPEGLFDQLGPRFATGGAVEPWMYQLQKGHEFAAAQSGKPYQWAGPRFVGDSFDCSGFMGSIAAAILGGNPWQRYWATSSFAGYPAVGPQGFTRNQLDGGMVIGVTDDPGGPGGGHTAGVLGALPLLGIPGAMRAESGGALGNVHYGTGTDPRSFASVYGLPIGANGYFQPGIGGGSVGPSPADQAGFVESAIRKAFTGVLDPIRSRIAPPPPEWRKIPGEYLTTAEDAAVGYTTGLVGKLGEALPSVWHAAESLASSAFDALNPFDSGGVATGTGFLPKNIVDPERVLSPEQTRLFDALVVSLGQIAGGGGTSSGVPDLLTNATYTAGVDELLHLLGVQQAAAKTSPDDQAQLARSALGDLAQRTQSDRESAASRAQQEQSEKLQALLSTVIDKLSGDVLGPVLRSAFDAANQLVRDMITAAGKQVVAGTDRTTAAVKEIADHNGATPGITPDGNNAGPGAQSPFGAPGSAFDAVAEVSKAIQSVAQAATSAFQQVAQQVANAALAQQDSKVANSRGTLGKDISGGEAADLIIKLTGVNIEIRDNLINTTDEIKKLRGDQSAAFDTTGRIISDTADLMQRNQSSQELVVSEINRINQALIKALLRYLVSSILIPILTAILSAMIQVVVTAIGAAIGSIIPGIGTAIGAAIGAVVGAALAGVAAVVVGGLAVAAGAAIDSFDEGGVASGIGFLPKNTLAPERVLSPRQTDSFDRMVAALEGGGSTRNTTVYAPINYSGGASPAQVSNHLLSLLS